ITEGAGTTLAAGAAVTNGTGLAYQVTATKLTVTKQPPSPATGGTAFDLVIKYTDISGNVDVDVTDSISAIARSDAGAVNGPGLPAAASSGSVSFTGAGGVVCGLPAATGIHLVITDDAGGTLNAANVNTNPFNVIDTTLPTISSIVLDVAGDPTGKTIKVTFSEPLDPTTAATTTNYTLHVAAATWTPGSATLSGGNLVTLTFSDYAVAGTDTLDLSGVKDVALNTMAAANGQAVTSADVTAPTLSGIAFNDMDGSGTVTAGDEYRFTFSEAINDRVFTGATAANTLLSPAGLSYGTPNSMAMGNDLGLATDSRMVVVTIVSGTTVTGTQAITLGAITDVSGNTVAATGLTLTLTDTIGPRLLSTALDDRDNNGSASEGDVLYLAFNEAMAPASMPAINTAGQLDTALPPSAGSYGSNSTAVLGGSGKVLGITLGTSAAGIVGATINPAASVTDVGGNADTTAAGVAVATGSSDTFAPTFTIAYSAPNPNAVGAGSLTITATFSDTQGTTPTIAIAQPGTNDLAATAMTAVGATGRVFSYTWTVNVADGVVNADGLNTVTIAGAATDGQGNALVPAVNNTFTTDTTGPIFGTVSVSDPDSYYKVGDTISIDADLNEAGLTVRANLNTADTALSATAAFTDNSNGTYSLTSGALASLTMVEGTRTITVTATDGAGNSATWPVIVVIDKTAPFASLLYNKPRAAVGSGSLLITLSLTEPASAVPTIAIAGLTGTSDVTATSMTGSVGDATFTYTLNVVAGTTGTATVTIAGIADLAGNVQASVANNTFTTTTSASAVTANAGPDQSLPEPQLVNLDGSGSSGGGLTYAWTQSAGPSASLAGSTTATPSFYAATPGVYLFRLTVTSGASSADDTVQVEIANCEPVVDAGTRVTLDESEISGGKTALGLSGSAMDCNGETLFVVWTLTSRPVGGNLVIDSPNALASTLTVAGGASTITAGVYVFQLDVYDAAGLAGSTPVSDEVRFVVIGAGTVPPAAHAGIDRQGVVGTSLQLTANESSDSDGTITGYAWELADRPTGSAAALVGTATATPALTADVAGTYVIRLRVTDNDGLESDWDYMTVTAHSTGGAGNRIPRAVIEASLDDTNADNAHNTGEELALDGRDSQDADGDTLTYHWRQVAGPVALRLDDPTSGDIAVTPTVAGNYAIELVVNDGTSDGIAAEHWFTVTTAGAAPVAVAAVSSTDDPNADGRLLFIPGVGVDNLVSNPSVELVSTGSTGSGLTFAWRQVAGPTVALTGVATATASFVPELSRVYEFELVVTDSNGVRASDAVFVIVDTYDATANPTGNAVPQANAGAPVSATTGALITLHAAGTDANTPQASWIYYWVQVGGPPVVLDLTDPANPTFTAPRAAVYTFELYIDDGFDISTASLVSATVANPSGDGGGGGDGGGCAAGNGLSGLWLLLAGIGLAAWLRRRRRAA
ncbi:MAG: hypothetical protein IT463_00645, partial [Planctomycetes bacterium]|nr:hypothetical protein [Planctomycetota bacterium]